MSGLMTFLAILLGSLAYAMLNIGLAIQKKGAAQLPDIENQGFFKNLKNFLTNKFWLIGFLLVNLQIIPFSIALTIGELSIVAPMMGVGLVALILFSVFYLKEKISAKEIIAIVIIIAGIVVLGATSINEPADYLLEDITNLLLNNGSIIFLVVATVLMFLLVIFSIVRKFALADIMFGIAAGIASGIGVIFTKGFMTGLKGNNFSEIWQSLKTSVVLWVWWFYLGLLLVYNIISTIFPQVGFQKGKAIVVTPLFAIAALLTPIIGGIIIFSEWDGLNPGILAAKIIAIVLVLIGVILLSLHSSRSKSGIEIDEESEEVAEEKEEDVIGEH
ncbi:MAG: DMT family transporter [Candidatus Heimdallarchaeota archaeon]